MTTKEIFIDNIHEHSLSVTIKNKKTVYTLFYSYGEQWCDSVKGTIALQVVDDGNDVKIVGCKGNKFNYSEAPYLSIILREIHKDYTFEQGTKESM